MIATRTCLQALLLAFIAASALAQTNLHGTVCDATGAISAGATVTLTCDETPALSAQTSAGGDGTYRFAALAPCRYRVSAQRQQLTALPLMFPVTTSTGKEAQLDLTLVAELASGAATPPRPKFAASGIRGLIDPGGYSAPANAAAATGLLTGMAEVNRNSSASSSNCNGKVLAELQNAHEKNPGDAAATLNLAEVLVAQQQFDRARVLVTGLSSERLAAFDERRALRLLAHIDEGTGNFAAASLQYHRLASIEPSADNSFAEGYELILAGQPEAAAIVYRKGLGLYPGSPALLIGAGTTEFLGGHTLEAITLFLHAAETDPADPRPYPFLAATSSVAAGEGERVRVLAALEHHLTLAPRDAPAHLALAVVLLHGPQAIQPSIGGRAEAELRQALGIDPALADAHFQLGTLLARQGADEEAIRELQLAVQLDPERREAHYHSAQALRKVGQTEAAAREMQRFQETRATDAADGTDVRQFLSVMKQPASGLCIVK